MDTTRNKDNPQVWLIYGSGEALKVYKETTTTHW
jgi:hypothetical protein